MRPIARSLGRQQIKIFSFEEARREENRRKIWAAAVNLAAAIGSEPEEQSVDALRVYHLAVKISRERYGDELI